MPSDELKDLESLDLSSLTVADLARMKNDVLRRALLAVIEEGIDAGAQHTNHWAFTSHAKAIHLETLPETRPEAT